MKVFIDCEYNSFGGDLITMALVTMDGREPYAQVPIDRDTIHPWVVENVIPVIDAEGTDAKMLGHLELTQAIEAFLAIYDEVHIIADWPDDIRFFCQYLITGPGTRIDTPPLTMEVRRDIDAVSDVPHNALLDARAIRYEYCEVTDND